MRLGKLDENPIEVDWPIMEMQPDTSVKVATIKRWKRFRKYAQSRFITMRNLSTLGGAKVRWFKEFGDPRQYNNETGELLDGKKLAETPVEKRSNEMVHLKIYCARSPYGLPRFIGNLLSIFGDRAAEEINYTTFRNNNIPSMVVLVSNGQLTEGSIQRIESFVESQIQGSDNYSKFLLLEAEGVLEGEDPGQIKLAIEPLVQNQHKDALFQNYSANNQDKVRRAFRIPPIFVGRSDDYTRATAESSRVLADEQIFAPEREEFDGLINRIIFPQMGIVYHKFKSNTPNTTDNAELIGILNGAEKTGALTPRIARNIMEDILGIDLPPFIADFPADIPFSQTMAEAVKNFGQPNEPGQQVTALKVMKAIYGDTTEADEAAKIVEACCQKCGHKTLVTGNVGDPLVDHLVSLNKRLEKKWREAVVKAEEAEDEAESGS
jgi:PBSX family phage portal protein